MITGWKRKKDAMKALKKIEATDGRVFHLLDGTYAAAGDIEHPLAGGRDRTVHGPRGQRCSTYEVVLKGDIVHD